MTHILAACRYVLEATFSDHSMLRANRWETITAKVLTGGTATIQVMFGMSSNDSGGTGKAWFDNFILNGIVRQVVTVPDCSGLRTCAGRYVSERSLFQRTMFLTNSFFG